MCVPQDVTRGLAHAEHSTAEALKLNITQHPNFEILPQPQSKRNQFTITTTEMIHF